MSKINFEMKSIGEILNRSNLQIPNYQRPYKWGRKHIRNLFYDVREAIIKNVSSYRIGSVILHNKNQGGIDIVDGQQRLVSISLFLYFYNSEQLPIGAKNLLVKEYVETSQKNAKNNYDEWESLCNLITEEELDKFYDYLLNKCSVSVIEMPAEALSEAFQLFDAQNNRGKKLNPHDLLKAYHLRTIGNEANESTVAKWEIYNDISNNGNELNLTELFDKHLFRIRRWANGETGLTKKRYGSELKFTENYIDDFKGVDISDNEYPYLELYKELKKHEIEFPNSLCMPIIDGDAFFKFVEYAYNFISKSFYTKESLVEPLLSNEVYEFTRSNLSSYQRNINLFENLILLYVDRFGAMSEVLNREICEKVFVWAFFPRVKASAIYDSTLANYAAGERFQNEYCQKLFHILMTSYSPNNFISKIDTDILNNFTSEGIITEIKDKKERRKN